MIRLLALFSLPFLLAAAPGPGPAPADTNQISPERPSLIAPPAATPMTAAKMQSLQSDTVQLQAEVLKPLEAGVSPEACAAARKLAEAKGRLDLYFMAGNRCAR